MKAIICDKCKQTMLDEKEMREALRLDLCNDKIGKWDEKHLCYECRKKFLTWLNN